MIEKSKKEMMEQIMRRPIYVLVHNLVCVKLNVGKQSSLRSIDLTIW